MEADAGGVGEDRVKKIEVSNAMSGTFSRWVSEAKEAGVNASAIVLPLIFVWP